MKWTTFYVLYLAFPHFWHLRLLSPHSRSLRAAWAFYRTAPFTFNGKTGSHTDWPKCRWVNDDRIFILSWTMTLRSHFFLCPSQGLPVCHSWPNLASLAPSSLCFPFSSSLLHLRVKAFPATGLQECTVTWFNFTPWVLKKKKFRDTSYGY